MKIEMQPLGIVKNQIIEPQDPSVFEDVESIIEIQEEFSQALFRINDSDYIQVFFYLHKSHRPQKMINPTRMGEIKGIFASRTPHRLNPIGMTTVQLLSHNGNQLRVKGLDAINGTPILDIKPFTPKFDDSIRKTITDNIQIKNPRMEIIDLIKKQDLIGLLTMAGTLHGHYCLGLALGIHLSMRALKEIKKFSDGVAEDLIAIVEMNNCAVDGIQYVTGCSLGNNALIYRDLGKYALTLAIRGGKGVRVTVRNDWREEANVDPEFTLLFQKVIRDRSGTDLDKEKFKQISRRESFKLVEQPSENIISLQEVDISLPTQAPIYESFSCAKCGELTMGSRKDTQKGIDFCFICGNHDYYELSGHGMQKIQKN